MATDEDRNLEEQGPTERPVVSFQDFAAWMNDAFGEDALVGLENITPLELFSWVQKTTLSAEELSQRLSEFSGIPQVANLEEENLEFRTLSRPFCQARLVVAVKGAGLRETVVVSNPFDWELLDDLERTVSRGQPLGVLLAPPAVIRAALGMEEPEPEPSEEDQVVGAALDGPEDGPPSSEPERDVYEPELDPEKDHPVAALAIEILTQAVRERASHLVLQPDGPMVVVRATIDGKPHDLRDVSMETGKMLVARFKTISGMDPGRKKTPQNGALGILLGGKNHKIKVTTSPTAVFENLTVRVLDPFQEAVPFDQLGLAKDQALLLRTMASRDEGMILFAGPRGSGKTTTVYSLLSDVARQERTVITVEDPIEHRIRYSVQQEAGQEVGVRTLLQNTIEEEPDVLFLSEIKDLESARTCFEFAASGHLVLSTMNSSNSATAIFRLERMGVSRSDIAENLIGVVAQRLLGRLCPECKETRSISREESSLLSPFTGDVPEVVGHPVGCSSCGGTGYMGHEGVFEVIGVGPRMSKLIQDGRPISELKAFAQARGDLLAGDHGIRKIRKLSVSVDEVYRRILLEEGVPLIPEVEEEMELAHQSPELEEEMEVAHPGPELEEEMEVAYPGPEFEEEMEVAYPGPEVEEEVEVAHPGPGVEAKQARTYRYADLSLANQTTILVVEDEEGTLFLIEQILSKAGYRVVPATNGVEALQRLGGESIDLILSDIHMPNLDGLKLLEVLNQQGIDTPVVLLTGEPSPDVEAQGRQMGAADYIRKPIQRDVILACLEGVLGEASF